ncbi:MAG: SUMF1/EgtB/PvdO family nonheme iron enzyme [Acidobacteriota bacterium]
MTRGERFRGFSLFLSAFGVLCAAGLAAAQNAGDLYAVDTIVGNLRYVPATGAGGYLQGYPGGDPCLVQPAFQFQHVLTRNLAVMQTEVTQQMWDNLRALQPTLPAASPSTVGAADPVDQVSWHAAVLCANLLSLQQGLTRCYYTDASMAVPIDASNYAGNDTIYCSFAANGYRLPTEGEWEHFTRAGTTGAFSVNEPAYGAASCSGCTPGLLPALESVAWFCANSGFSLNPAGTRLANPWNLQDVHGSVQEWCWDWYGDYPSASQTDYTGPGNGVIRVVRSGSFLYTPSGLTSYFRGGTLPANAVITFGLRLVRSIVPAITSIKSKTSKPGKNATIRGSGFSATKSANTVYFGKKKVTTIKKASTSQLVVVIPSVRKGWVNVVVTVAGQKSRPFAFQVK